MKKRILSVLLAVVMVAAVFVVPTSVSAADDSAWYSYEFEENDIRNHVAGQVVDLGVTGEVASVPVMDGEIGDDEYSATSFIPRRTASLKKLRHR